MTYQLSGSAPIVLDPDYYRFFSFSLKMPCMPPSTMGAKTGEEKKMTAGSTSFFKG